MGTGSVTSVQSPMLTHFPVQNIFFFKKFKCKIQVYPCQLQGPTPRVPAVQRGMLMCLLLSLMIYCKFPTQTVTFLNTGNFFQSFNTVLMRKNWTQGFLILRTNVMIPCRDRVGVSDNCLLKLTEHSLKSKVKGVNRIEQNRMGFTIYINYGFCSAADGNLNFRTAIIDSDCS